MIDKLSVEKTTDISIYIQIISFYATSVGISYKLPTEHLIITDLLVLETIVQLIELIELVFYLTFLKNMSKTVTDMAKTRYYDWFITTPTMLLTTIVYFEYLHRIELRLDLQIL
jgi:hypothetical protein